MMQNKQIKPGKQVTRDFKVKISMIQLYKLIETTLNNTDEIIRSPYLEENNKNILTQIISNGKELLNHIKSYVKNDIALLMSSSKKAKIKNKKNIMSIFNKKTTMIITSIASIQIQVLSKQYQAEQSAQPEQDIIVDSDAKS